MKSILSRKVHGEYGNDANVENSFKCVVCRTLAVEGLNYLVTKRQSAAMSIFYKIEKKLKFLNCQNCKDE